MRIYRPASVLGAALAISALTLLTHSGPASAFTLRLAPADNATQSASTALPVEKVGHRGDRRYKYDRRRHGPRYRHPRGRNRYHYGGYWYIFPWWLGMYSEPYYGPYYDGPRRPRYSSRSCDYWSRRCSENWSRRQDYLGCLRYHGCL